MVDAGVIQAPEDVGEVVSHVLRFKPHRKPVLELNITVTVVAARPVQWSLR